MSFDLWMQLLGTMKVKYPYIFLLIFLLTLMVNACKHEIPVVEHILPTGSGGINPDTVVINSDPCNPDTVYFENTILPMLVSKCAQPECHDAITHQKGIRLYNYVRVMSSGVVQPGNPDDSEMIAAITGIEPDTIMPPPPNDPLTAEQITWIKTWIQQGAKNNACIEECDPSKFSFSANLLPVIEFACEGCHGINGTEIELTTYSQISAVALDGRLMSALKGINGYQLMPYNTGGLPLCNIEQFQVWVNAGAPNN
ncbi:MAG: hypothetical protein IT223_07650 [Crocinitomicaceae bacterium]|nr:hypothetical protein [Crocinitomicaceae bacterium]